MLRRLILACLLLLPGVPALAQVDEVPSLSDVMVMRAGDDPKVCRLIAAGILEQGVAALEPSREPPMAGLVLAQAPISAYADLGCNVTLLQDILDCMTTAYVRQRRELVDPQAVVGHPGLTVPEAAVRCAADPPFSD